MFQQPKPEGRFRFSNTYPAPENVRVPYLVNEDEGEEGDVLTKDANNQPAWETPAAENPSEGTVGQVLTNDGAGGATYETPTHPVWADTLTAFELVNPLLESIELPFSGHVAFVHLAGAGTVVADTLTGDTSFALRFGATVAAITTYLASHRGVMAVAGVETYVNGTTWLGIDAGTAAEDLNVWFELRLYKGAFGLCGLHVDGAWYNATNMIPFSFRGQVSRAPMDDPDPNFLEVQNTAAAGPSASTLQMYLMSHGVVGSDSNPSLAPPF